VLELFGCRRWGLIIRRLHGVTFQVRLRFIPLSQLIAISQYTLLFANLVVNC
jgi:hypothetical protein